MAKAFRVYKPDYDEKLDSKSPPTEIEVEIAPFLDEVEEGDEIAVLLEDADGEKYCFVGAFEIRHEGFYPNSDPKSSFWIV